MVVYLIHFSFVNTHTFTFTALTVQSVHEAHRFQKGIFLGSGERIKKSPSNMDGHKT